MDELAPRLLRTVSTADRRPSTAASVTGSALLDAEQGRVLDAVPAGPTTAQIEALVRREIAVIDPEAAEQRVR